MSDVNQELAEAFSRLPRVDVKPLHSALHSTYSDFDIKNSLTPADG